jgi:hypothetical protein
MNAIDFECPACGAKPGERCHTLTGKANPVSHAKRKQAALDIELHREDANEADAGTVEETTEKAGSVA